MEEIREICPGVYAVGGEIAVCPGCGCPELGLDPGDPKDVEDFYVGVYAALRSFGMTRATDEEAIRLARSYMEEPWHEKW